MSFLLKQLLDELKDDPKKISEIEVEVDKIIKEPDMSYVRKSVLSSDSNFKFYILVIIEKKIKLLKENNENLCEIVQLCEELVKTPQREGFLQKKLAMIYAKVGVFEWPNNFPTFFNTLIDLMCSENLIGYLILENFLYLIRNSFDVSEDRRSELKRTIITGINVIIDILSRKKFTEETISIYTHLFSIFPVAPLDFKIIFEKGELFVEKTLDLLLESVYSKKNDESFVQNLINFSKKIEVHSKMIECFILSRENIYRKNIDMYSYVFKGLSSGICTFSSSLQFWLQLFKRKGNSNDDIFYINLGKKVLEEVIRVASNSQDDEISSLKFEDMEADVFNLITMISQNHPICNNQVLNELSDDISRKYAVLLIKNNRDRRQIRIKDIYLRAYNMFLDNDKNCIELIEYMNAEDEDNCKLISSIIQKFDMDNEFLLKCYSKFRDCRFNDELIVNISLKINNDVFFSQILSTEMSIKKSHYIFYFLKHKPEIVAHCIPDFYGFFMRSKKPFDRYFAIIGLIYKIYGSLPNEIIQKVYSEFDGYDVLDIKYFILDLLSKLDEQIQRYFIEKIFFRLKSEWKVSEDQRSVCLATKSFLNIIESLILKHKNTLKDMQYSDIMVEFLHGTNGVIFNKISSFYRKHKFMFNTEKMTYYLLMSYNSFEFIDQQNEIISLLAECIKKDDGPSVLSKFNFDTLTCMRIRELMYKNSEKPARMLIKDVLSQIKAIPPSKMYQSSIKIQSQNLFLKKKINHHHGDHSTLDFDFIEKGLS